MKENTKKGAKEPLYKILYVNQNKVVEIHCKNVYQSSFWGFIEIEDLVFAPNNSLIVDPSEEQLKQEFSTVKRSFIPLQSIVRIDEVDHPNPNKVTSYKKNKDGALNKPIPLFMHPDSNKPS